VPATTFRARQADGAGEVGQAGYALEEAAFADGYPIFVIETGS
jgi:hypothetical protein